MKTYMKKNILICLVLITLIITGCTFSPKPSSQASPSTEIPPLRESPTPTPKKQRIIEITAGQKDSELYSLGNRIASLITENISDLTVNIKPTNGVMENLQSLALAKADITIGYGHHVMMANQSNLMNAFPDAPSEKITIKCGVETIRAAFPDYALPFRIILPLGEQPLLLITRDLDGINTLSDLKGKRISTGEPESETEELARYALAGLGLGWDKDILRNSQDTDTSLRALKNGEVDAIFFAGSEREIASLISEVKIDIRLIPIDGEDAETIMQANPNIFHKSSIIAGAFTGVDTDVETLAVSLVLIAKEDFPANQVLSAIFENKENISSETSNFDLEVFISQIGSEAQNYLHEDSIAYFTEQGILTR